MVQRTLLLLPGTTTLLKVIAVVVLPAALSACLSGGGGSGSSGKEEETGATDVVVSWVGSRHSTMNRPGSGYTVYYSSRPGVQPGSSGVKTVDVPYDPDTGKTPTTAVIEKLKSGTWYFRIQAYASLDTASVQEQLISDLSPEMSFTPP